MERSSRNKNRVCRAWACLFLACLSISCGSNEPEFGRTSLEPLQGEEEKKVSLDLEKARQVDGFEGIELSASIEATLHNLGYSAAFENKIRRCSTHILRLDGWANYKQANQDLRKTIVIEPLVTDALMTGLKENPLSENWDDAFEKLEDMGLNPRRTVSFGSEVPPVPKNIWAKGWFLSEIGWDYLSKNLMRGLFRSDGFRAPINELAESVRISGQEAFITIKPCYWHDSQGAQKRQVCAEDFVRFYEARKEIEPNLSNRIVSLESISDNDLKMRFVGSAASALRYFMEACNYPMPLSNEENLVNGQYCFDIVDGHYVLEALEPGILPKILLYPPDYYESDVGSSLDRAIDVEEREKEFLTVPLAITDVLCLNTFSVYDDHYLEAIRNIHFRRGLLGLAFAGIDTSGNKRPSDSLYDGVVRWDNKSEHDILGSVFPAKWDYQKAVKEKKDLLDPLFEFSLAKKELGEAFFKKPVILPFSSGSNSIGPAIKEIVAKEHIDCVEVRDTPINGMDRRYDPISQNQCLFLTGPHKIGAEPWDEWNDILQNKGLFAKAIGA